VVHFLEVFEVGLVPGNVESDAPVPVLLLVEVADGFVELGAANLYLALDVFGLEATGGQLLRLVSTFYHIFQVNRQLIRNKLYDQFLKCRRIPIILTIDTYLNPTLIINSLHPMCPLRRHHLRANSLLKTDTNAPFLLNQSNPRFDLSDAHDARRRVLRFELLLHRPFVEVVRVFQISHVEVDNGDLVERLDLGGNVVVVPGDKYDLLHAV